LSQLTPTETSSDLRFRNKNQRKTAKCLNTRHYLKQTQQEANKTSLTMFGSRERIFFK